MRPSRFSFVYIRWMSVEVMREITLLPRMGLM